MGITYYTDGETFEREGLKFRVNIPYDDSGRAPPWEECDGHGPVSDWTHNAKGPGDRELCRDGSSRRFYRWQEAIQIAKRDGWGLCKEDKEKIEKTLGRPMTKGEICAEAVQRDFDYLRRWCNNNWWYVGVIVTLLDDDEEDTDDTESVWGIESFCDDYILETAHDLADEIIRRLKDSENETAAIRTFECAA